MGSKFRAEGRKREAVGSRRENDVCWVLVNCTSVDEATRIGETVLAARQASCFDVFRRERSRYFWPPQSGNIEESAGALLVLETLAPYVAGCSRLVRADHGDELPFIGTLRIEQVSASYREWMQGELAPRTS